ncbi:SusC/RagA family TonB-linked outer membrane protein [Aquimarina megaterium]|uniref:SusC/RagA family TonB-linked outer membrane protein n=1 Tax=Aquimarina megaterium TaxID=1443666 RepID=UPI000471A7C9|nr:SusC/RagA family TonB-linked outer membrane protein [Aquimarina megaterium]
MEKKRFPKNPIWEVLDKIKEVMKYMSLFLLLFLLYSFTNSYAQNKKLRLDLKDATLMEMINGIEKQSEFVFIYGDEVVPILQNKKRHVIAKGENIHKILDTYLEKTELTYYVKERQVILKKREESSKDKLNVAFQSSVSGTVRDVNGPIPGVTILVKGTSRGTTTDFDGEYTINIEVGDVLVYSYIGFTKQEVTVGNQTTIDVVLNADAQALEEVVINALGFETSTKRLGSAVSSVAAKALVRSGETSVANAIQGKMAGVNIRRSNGDPGSGTNIRIRGGNTIFGNTQPLIIVDGIPINNSNAQGGASSATGNGTSQQSRLNDINPNDIETLQVLKGASAAALWGSRASNGVIVITTKSGRKGFKVSFKNSLSIDEVTETAPLQSNYGQGLSGRYRYGYLHGWGDEISSRTGGQDTFVTTDGFFIGDQTGSIYYPIASGTSTNPHGGKNSKETFLQKNFNQVFRTAVLIEQSVSISAGDDKSNIFFSLGNTDQEGVIRNNDYKRHTVNISALNKFNDWVRLKIKGKYSRISANRVQQNSNTAGLLLGFYRNISDFDIQDYTGTYVNASGTEFRGRHRSYRNPIGETERPRYNNPLWTTNAQKAPNIVNRHIYSADLDLFPFNGFNIKLRGGVDTYNDKRTYLYPRGSARTGSQPRLEGNLTFDNISETELNFDAIAKYDANLNNDISTSLVLGWNINDRKFDRETVVGSDFIVNEEIYSLTNSRIIQGDNFIRHIRSNRGYATANFGLFDQLYIDVSGTIEAASTIKSPFFYPSASAAWQFSNAGFFPEDSFISFGKVRLSWGKVGIQPVAYRSSTNYEGDFTYSNGIFGNLSSTNHGGGFRLDNRLGNSNLKPEIKTEIETGLELQMFNNRLSTSFTYYTNKIEDILLTLDRAPSSGFTSFYTNGASMKNQGFEFEFNANVLQGMEDWVFSVYGNFGTNKNEVTSLAGAEVQRLTGFGTGDSVAAVGYQMGAIFGGKLPRNTDGSIVLDANGFPEGTPVYDVIGDPNPDWTGGIGFNFGYKNLSINVLMEHSQGGDFYDMTRQINSQRGFSAESGNKVTIPVDGIRDVTGNTYVAGDIVRGNLYDFGGGQVLLEQNWYRGNGAGNRGFSELWLQDATWTRLREINLTYSFGEKVLEKLRISELSIGLTGRNLALWTDVIGNDPDKNFAGVGNSRGLDYYTNPTTKSYLFNLNLTF